MRSKFDERIRLNTASKQLNDYLDWPGNLQQEIIAARKKEEEE